jgi:hypothetical protein
MTDTSVSAATILAKLDEVGDALAVFNSRAVDPNRSTSAEHGNRPPPACCDSCAAGGPCGGDCSSLKMSREMTGIEFPPSIFGPWYQAWVGAGGCGLTCRPVDPTLNWYLCSMTSRVDMWAMANYMRLDDDIVSVNTSVGAAPDYVDFPTVPLAASQSMVLRSASQQRLPWRPGCIRVVAEWAPAPNQPRPSSLDITWYTADRDLTDVTAEQVSSQFTQVGNTKKLSSYISNDDCCLFPFPKFLNCTPPPIPDLRALYAVLTLGAVGTDALIGLNLEIIKAGTDECGRCLSICKGKGCSAC